MTNKQFIETFVTLCEGYGVGPWECGENSAAYTSKHMDVDMLINEMIIVRSEGWGWKGKSYKCDSPQAYADKVREILEG